jgi:hypothetical protein
MSIINGMTTVGRFFVQNTLWYGDNLDILREHIPSESMDFLDRKRPDAPCNQRPFSKAERMARSTHQQPAMIALLE